MINRILGLIVGLTLGITISALAALPVGRQPREYQKFIETSTGQTAVLITITQ